MLKSLLPQRKISNDCVSSKGATSSSSSSDTRLVELMEQKWPPSTSVMRHHDSLLREKRGRSEVIRPLGSCEGRRASPIIIPDEEPVDLRGVLRRRFQGTVDGEEVIVDALETRVRG